jgi:hypothetical protein
MPFDWSIAYLHDHTNSEAENKIALELLALRANAGRTLP